MQAKTIIGHSIFSVTHFKSCPLIKNVSDIVASISLSINNRRPVKSLTRQTLLLAFL